MSEIVEKLAACERITEWVTPWDKRLGEIAGIPVPRAGGNLRELWELTDTDEENEVVHHVGRLLIPAGMRLHGEITTRFASRMYKGSGNVELEFSDARDWSACFPVSNNTEIFMKQDRQVWAALALSNRIAGLAIFAVEQDHGGVLARVQRVPEEDLQRL